MQAIICSRVSSLSQDYERKLIINLQTVAREKGWHVRRTFQELAKIRQKYNGRRVGARTSPSALLNKYQNVSDLIDKSDLSLRRIAGITGHSINTVRKIKELKEI